MRSSYHQVVGPVLSVVIWRLAAFLWPIEELVAISSEPLVYSRFCRRTSGWLLLEKCKEMRWWGKRMPMQGWESVLRKTWRQLRPIQVWRDDLVQHWPRNQSRKRLVRQCLVYRCGIWFPKTVLLWKGSRSPTLCPICWRWFKETLLQG